MFFFFFCARLKIYFHHQQNEALFAETAALFHSQTEKFYEGNEALLKATLKAKEVLSSTPASSTGHSTPAEAPMDAPQPLMQQRRKIQRLHEVVVDAMIGQAKEEKRQQRAVLADNEITLGKVVTQSFGGDVWIDGSEPKEITRQLQELEKLRKDIRDNSKELRTLLHTNSSEEKNTETEIALEVNRRKLDYYRRFEQDLQSQHADFKAKKAIHIKEQRRFRDEAHSLYSKYPLLDHGRYLVLSMLGKGGFSEVWRGCDIQTCQLVAIKIHQCCSTWTAEKKAHYLRHARREFDIQQRARHERVVSLLDCFELNQDSFCTILQYTPYGDLDSYIKKHREIPEGTARCLIVQIISGLAYLHELKVIHYDLKPGNVLFFSPSEVKLTDFGLSKNIVGSGTAGEETAIDLTSQGSGTYWYLPPECFETRFVPKVTAKVDIWAVGVVFYQMLFGKRPFGHDSTQKQLFSKQIIFNAGAVEFPAKPKVSDTAKDIIQRCCTRESTQRPSAAELITEPYFFQTVGPGAKRMQQRTAAVVAASTKRPRTLLTDTANVQKLPPPTPQDAEKDEQPSAKRAKTG